MRVSAALIVGFLFGGCTSLREGYWSGYQHHPKMKCIVFLQCSEQEQIRAVEEYVGAVYGEVGRVRYDGTLSAAEQRYVEETFGKLVRRSDADRYLDQARVRLVGALESRYGGPCEAIDFDLYKFSSSFGRGVVLAGYHYCGQRFSSLFSSIETRIAASPGDWVFFIEGAERSRQEETGLFRHIAVRLNIPIYEAVLPPWHPRVIQETERRFGVGRFEQAVGTVAMFTLQDYGRCLWSSRHPKSCRLGEHRAELVESYAPTFGVPERELEAGFLRAYAPLPDSKEKLEEGAKRMADRYVSVSNELTVGVVKRIIERKKKRNAFFQMGSAHLPIVERIYAKDD